MESPSSYVGLLLGLVEVKCTMADMSREQRLDLTKTCHDVVCSRDRVKAAGHGVLGQVEKNNASVEIFLDKETIQVFIGKILITKHKVVSVSVLNAIRGTQGKLVFIGRCQLAKQRLAVVLNFVSEKQAQEFIQNYQMVKANSIETLPSNSKPIRPLPIPPGKKPAIPPPDYEEIMPATPRGQIYEDVDSTPSRPPSHSMAKRPLPEIPRPSPPAPKYEAPYRSLPPPIPERYENPEELVKSLPPTRFRSFADPNVDVYNWSDDELSYEEVGEQYYESIGIDVKDAEQIYMSTSLIKEEEEEPQQQAPYEESHKEEQKQQEKKQAEVEEEEPETTLEEDIDSFLRDEYKFKSTFWRIREAIFSLSRELQILLRGTEMLADIQNDMYVELHEGCKSPSRIAQVFISRKAQLERYKYYLLNSPKISRLIEAQPEGVKQMFPRLQEDVRSSWKRLYFYSKSMEKMLATAPLQDAPIIQEALHMLRDLTRQADSGILMDAVKGAPFKLHDLAPLFLHSSFHIKSSSLEKRKTDYRVLLFAELLVVTVPRVDNYEYVDFIPTRRLRVLPTKDERAFVLETMYPGEREPRSYGFRAPSVESKQVWIKMMKQILREHKGMYDHGKISGLRK